MQRSEEKKRIKQKVGEVLRNETFLSWPFEIGTRVFGAFLDSAFWEPFIFFQEPDANKATSNVVLEAGFSTSPQHFYKQKNCCQGVDKEQRENHCD
jgi:hypothetical protein